MSNDKIKPRSLRELAQHALDVQDACNLSGVVRTFAQVLSELWSHVNGTIAVNEHPISVLFADKIAHLTGTQHLGDERIMAAYTAVRKIVEAAEDIPSTNEPAIGATKTPPGARQRIERIDLRAVDDRGDATLGLVKPSE